jgi:predicted O-methyltransferase YrrM
LNFNEIKDKIIRNFCIKTWRIWEKFGIHISPNHFYWPIPDSKDVLKYDFDKKFSLDGIRIDDSKMLKLLREISQYKKEYAEIHNESAYASNGDGAVLYGMVRIIRPRKIVEVGSGFSTKIALTALKKNDIEDGTKSRIIAIEPYPKPVLKELVAGNENVTLLQSKVQEVGLEPFKELQSGDILFIDSSHLIAIGNDVHHLYLSVLPKVAAGTVIHIHDIRFPFDYPKDWVLKAKKFWTEQYLLQMFLAFNDSFEILFAGNYMYDKYPKLMSDSLVGLNIGTEGWPGCFWMRRVK